MLADFRAFCRNEDNRLRDFWEGSKVQIPSMGLKDFERDGSENMDLCNIIDE